MTFKSSREIKNEVSLIITITNIPVNTGTSFRYIKYRNKLPVYKIYCKPDVLELVAPSFYISLLRPFLHSQVFRQNPLFKMQTF